MDTDLFQILALILLLGLLLTLFGVLQSLGAIRKALEDRASAEPAASHAAQPVAATPTRAANDEPETWARPPAELEPDGATRTGWPAPQEATGSTLSGVTESAASEPAASEPAASEPAASEGSASTGAGGRVLYGDSGLTTATPSEAALRPADSTAAASAGAAGSEMAGTTATDTPAGTTSSTAGTAGLDSGVGQDFGDGGSDMGTTGVGAGTTDTTAGTAGAGAVTERAGSAAEDPQEQPFERDGRWWFRRGDELLVYEEQTGQWVPADEPSSSGSVATPTPASSPAPAETESAAAEGQVTTQQEAVGSFWKCPSCGAVNGSTATSCRMCFTARP